MTLVAPYLGQQPVTDYGHRFSELKYAVKLPANSAVALAIPGDYPRYKAVIKALPGSRICVASNAVAVFAPGATFAPIVSEIVPEGGMCREVKAGDSLSFISDIVNTFVSVVLYSQEPNS